MKKFSSILNKNEIINDFSNSGESCAQNYCQINTQLIESFECFDKNIDNNKQFKCFWPKCGKTFKYKSHLNSHKKIISFKRKKIYLRLE